MLVADPVSQLRFEQLMVPCALHFRKVGIKFSKSVPPVFNAWVAFPRRRLPFLVDGFSFFVLMATVYPIWLLCQYRFGAGLT